VSLQDYVRIVRRSWLIIVAATLVGVAAAAALALAQTPRYVTTTSVFVSTSSAASVTDLSSGTSYSQQIARSFAEVVSTELILQPVIDELQLDTDVAALRGKVSATAQLNTVLVDISVTDTDPEQAALLANAITASLADAVPALAPSSAESDDSPVRVTVAQPAAVPERPASPNVPVFLAVGALLGLAIGVGGAVLREVLDTRVRGEHDVHAITDTPILGGIPFDAKSKERPLIVHADPKSPRAESFRSLRTNLQFLDFAERSRTFVVTSSVAGEGKSTTTANLAIALADSGHSVLVIEGDLRLPKIASYLGIEGGAGLTDVLIERARVEDVVQRWGRKNLFVLPAGQVPPNPSELLGSASMRRLLESLEPSFNFILIDTAPLLPVTDAAVLSKITSGAIIISSAGIVRRQQLAGAVTALDRVGAKLHGVVLNRLPVKGPDSYGQYGYGEVYGALEQSDAKA
jgi:polysaccharide biosynthesis transport protein